MARQAISVTIPGFLEHGHGNVGIVQLMLNLIDLVFQVDSTAHDACVVQKIHRGLLVLHHLRANHAVCKLAIIQRQVTAQVLLGRDERRLLNDRPGCRLI